MYFFVLQVKFSTKIFPKKIEIYESYNSGAVKMIEFMRPDNIWHIVWKTDAVQKIEKLRTFTPAIEVMKM